MKNYLINSNRIGVVLFVLLAVGGAYGVMKGNTVHCFTVVASCLMGWALWCEAQKEDDNEE